MLLFLSSALLWVLGRPSGGCGWRRGRGSRRVAQASNVAVRRSERGRSVHRRRHEGVRPRKRGHPQCLTGDVSGPGRIIHRPFRPGLRPTVPEGPFERGRMSRAYQCRRDHGGHGQRIHRRGSDQGLPRVVRAWGDHTHLYQRDGHSPPPQYPRGQVVRFCRHLRPELRVGSKRRNRVARLRACIRWMRKFVGRRTGDKDHRCVVALHPPVRRSTHRVRYGRRHYPREENHRTHCHGGSPR